MQTTWTVLQADDLSGYFPREFIINNSLCNKLKWAEV